MISQLSALKYKFGAIHTADTTDGKVTNRALLSTKSEKSATAQMVADKGAIGLSRVHMQAYDLRTR